MAKTEENFRDNSRWSLGGMTALVTGGSKGLGKAVVEELALLGAKVHTCARDETQLQERLREWQAKGFQVTTSVCDVSSRDQREKLMETVSSIFQGKLNILVNNVGTCITKPTTEFTAQDYSFLMATNLESAFHLSQLAHPLLKASRSGSIVLMSSAAGVMHINVGSIYGATKGAMNQLAKNLACEWASDNIRVNSVCPWFIATHLANNYLDDEELKKEVESKTPMGRAGKANEVSSVRRSPRSPNIIACRISLFSGSFLYNWSDNLRRRRCHGQRLLFQPSALKRELFVCVCVYVSLCLLCILSYTVILKSHPVAS